MPHTPAPPTPTSSRPRPRLRLLAVLAATVALFAGLSAVGQLRPAPAEAAGPQPCDLYSTGGTPCVAAYSSTRALYANYNGPLYAVKRASDGQQRDIPVRAAGDVVNAQVQDDFCRGTSCVIPVVYDQTSNHNDLTVFPRTPGPGRQGTDNSPADATAVPVTLNGVKAYGIYMPPRFSYRRAAANTRGTARGANPESIYMVASGTNVNNACCSDFGNVEAEQVDNNAGTMDTINLSTLNGTYNGNKAYGYGPWVQNDLENGVFQGATPVDTRNQGNPTKFVTALTRNNGVNRYSLKGADATAGTAPSTLRTWYDGALPTEPVIGPPGQRYSPMRLEGSIVLGAGGDNSNAGTATFFEGVMTTGFSSDAVDNQVQANIAAQRYDGVNSGGGPGSTITHAGKCVDVEANDLGGNGKRVQMWDCQTRAADQNWLGSNYGLHSLGTMSRCLDAVGNATANGTKVQLYDCREGLGGQQWLVRTDGTIFNPASGRCLDVPSNNAANGVQLQLYDCNGGPAQQFTVTGGVPIIPAIQGATSDTNNSTQNCVDVEGRDLRTLQLAVQTYSCETNVTKNPEAQDQKWVYNRSNETITSLGLCLDIDRNATANFSKLQVYTCNGAGGQRWQFRSDGSVFNPQSGRCLDVPQGRNDKQQLQIYDCIGGAAQRFTLN